MSRLKPETSALTVATLVAVILTLFFYLGPLHNISLLIVDLILGIALTLDLMTDKSISLGVKIGTFHIQIAITIVTTLLLYAWFTHINLGILGSALFAMGVVVLPGMSIIRIARITVDSSKWELIGLSYGVGFATLSVVGVLLLALTPGIRGGLLLGFVMMLSIISLVSTLRLRHRSQVFGSRSGLVVGYDDILLICVLLTLAIFYYLLYPSLANIPSADIYRNYLSARLLASSDSFSPTLSIAYPLFGVLQSLAVSVLNPSNPNFQISFLTLNLLSVISFYSMARMLLRGQRHQTPAIATMIWTLFAGLGWVAFISQGGSAQSFIPVLTSSDALSYGDLTFQRQFFYLSMEASFTLVFLATYLALRMDLTRVQRMILATLLTLPLPLLHPFASYLLYAVLICFAVVLSGEERRRLTDISYSLIAASTLCILLYSALYSRGVSSFSFTGFIIGNVVVAGTSSLLAHRHGLRLLVNSVNFSLLQARLIKAAAAILAAFGIGFLLTWINGEIAFNFPKLDLFGYVPWPLYPVKFGVAGFFAIIALFTLSKTWATSKRLVGTMLALIVSLVISLRTISTYQLELSSQFIYASNSLSNELFQVLLNLREERMFEAIKFPVAVLSSIGIVALAPIRKKLPLGKTIALALAISLLVLSGIESSGIGLQYYQSLASNNQPNPLETSAINQLQTMVLGEGNAVITSPSTSSSFLAVSEATVISTESTAIWTSLSPEFPLSVIRYNVGTPAYLYLSNTQDSQTLANLGESYLPSLATSAPTLIQNSAVQVKVIQNMTSPSPLSDAALMIPYDTDASSVLPPTPTAGQSSGEVLALHFDGNNSSSDFFKTTPSYSNVTINGSAFFNGVSSDISVPDANDVYPTLAVQFSFQPLNITKNQVIVSKFDYGLPDESWEVAQIRNKIVFKVSPDGKSEVDLPTPQFLVANQTYVVKCVYDARSLTISVNGRVIASRPYSDGIIAGLSDIIIGAELYYGHPVAYANMRLNYIQILNPPLTPNQQLFEAYDFLGLAELNYTTVLSGDARLFSYRTLILPYDDIGANSTLTSILNQGSAYTSDVVILNTNGYGPMLNYFGNLTQKWIIASVNGAGSSLQCSINASIITTNRGISTIATYSSGKVSTPFIMSRTYGKVTLVYVNLFPLVQQHQLFFCEMSSLVGSTMNSFVKPANRFSVSSWFTEPSMIFTYMNATGFVQLASFGLTAIRFDGKHPFFVESGGQRYEENASTISTNGYSVVEIQASQITIGGGFGYYSSVALHNATLTLWGEPTVSVSVGVQNFRGRSVTVGIPGDAMVLLRQPTVEIGGSTTFVGLQILHPPIIYTDGRTVMINGSIYLSMFSSDKFSVALPYSFGPSVSVSYQIPLMTYDEAAALLAAAPFILLAGSALVIVQILAKQMRKSATSDLSS